MSTALVEASVASVVPQGEEHPFGKFVRFWVFGVMLPSSGVAWRLTGGSLIWSFIAALLIPCLAVAQGATGILKYRMFYGDAPKPLSPSHGVVIVRKHSSSSNNSLKNELNRESMNQLQAATAIPLRRASSYPLSLGCQCGEPQHPAAPTYCETAAAAVPTTDFRKDSSSEQKFESQSSSTSLVSMEDAVFHSGNTLLEEQSPSSSSRRPVRLLVIGDSLAIGVGQKNRCSPVMPEVIAKTLSRHLDGRTVYWTCHGSPGASTGWIVRELTRGVSYLEEKREEDEEELEEEEPLLSQDAPAAPKLEETLSRLSNCSDTDDSSSDESSEQDARFEHSGMKQERRIWRERLKQHRKRFDPNALGPYDVVVVVTGSNDVKSEYFPFLLKGEDAEFWKEARERGGDYAKELRRVLHTLDRGMRLQLQSIRDSVQAATETVIELAEETIERLGKHSTAGAGQHFSSSFREKLEARREASRAALLEEILTEKIEQEDKGALAKHFPLVVLPGLPARALPLFRKAPLRWLAVPALDIQDMHKRSVARSHPGQVLFVPPPSIDDLATYENCEGEFWRQHCEEDTVLALRDIQRRDCQRIEADMRDYYEVKDPRRPTGKGLQKTSTGWFSCLFPRSAAPGTSIFSVDRVHPTDDGYDFWGRYIASAIVDEWSSHPQLQPPLQ